MSRPFNSRHAVYLLAVPLEWKPQRPWDFPPEATACVLVAKNLPMRDAVGYVRSHNKREMDARLHRGEPTGQWAIVAKYTRPRCRWVDSAAAVTKGGVA